MRAYANDLVTLPRLDANGANALATELLATAKGKKLPPPLETARTRLERADKSLRNALGTRLAVQPVDTARARAADVAEDAAFSATFDFLSGWAKLPKGKEPELAQKLIGVLFADGLKFTQLAFKLEWAEADARLRLIKETPEYEGAFATLGGEAFLANLRTAHKEYGEALGITTGKKDEAPAAAPVQEPLKAVRDAMRMYALRAMAHGDPDDANATELSDTLLRPLAEWTAARQAHKAQPQPPNPSPAPVPS